MPLKSGFSDGLGGGGYIVTSLIKLYEAGIDARLVLRYLLHSGASPSDYE